MKLLAIDGNSIINRAFYGIKLLSTKEGLYTNGIYGFLTTLLRLMEKESPDAVAVAFDLHAPTFRHKMYDGYKAGRKPMPPELVAQMPLLKELLTAMGISCLSLEGYEADDILGTLAARAAADDRYTCVIATGDRDSLQLISPHTRVLLSTTKMGRPEITDCDEHYLMEKYHLTPSGMIDLKALMGDASDKIPGVPGIGEKTALSLLEQFGSLDGIYESLPEADLTASVKAKLEAGKDSAYLSRTLGTIFCEVPISETFEDLKNAPKDDAKAAAMMRRFEMFSLLPKFHLDGQVAAEQKQAVIEAPALTELDKTAFLTALKPEDILTVRIDGDRFTLATSTAYFVTADPSEAAAVTACPNAKHTFDVKALDTALWEIGPIKNVVFDAVLAAYLINPGAKDYSLSHLCEEYAVAEGPGAVGMLTAVLSDRLEQTGMTKLLTEMEIPLAEVLVSMEKTGILVDTEAIARYGAELGERIDRLQAEIIDEVGYEFNINSPKQLGIALFEHLGLPCKKKTKSGYSTNAEILEELRYESPTVEKILEYRGLAKLKSTYCDGLVAAVGEDGRIHSTLNQTETRTGRISSTEPNLQNIPVRKEEGRQLRDCFHAAEGFVLADADYSQIELRVLAALSGDQNMVSAFTSGEDIHTATAAAVFKMPTELVTPALRSRAKAVNFGVIYGEGPFSLGKHLGIPFAEAKRFIADYLATYREVDAYLNQTVEKAKEDGYVTTLFGRRRPLPEIKASNKMLQSFGERVARNAPIQGTAADIIKMAMIRVYHRLAHELPEGKLLLQVHDELIIEAPQSKVDLACRILREEMEGAVSLAVQMEAEVHTGKTWLEAKD